MENNKKSQPRKKKHFLETKTGKIFIIICNFFDDILFDLKNPSLGIFSTESLVSLSGEELYYIDSYGKKLEKNHKEKQDEYWQNIIRESKRKEQESLLKKNQ